MYRLIISVVLVCCLQACSLGGGTAPENHYYRIPEITVEQQTSTGLHSVVIKPVKASGLYHERAILYVEKTRPLELKRYHYNFWSETPANLLQDALYQGLSSSKLATQISREMNASRPDLIINSRIVNFERVIDDSTVDVEVALDVTVLSGKDASKSWSRRYQSTQHIDSTDMYYSAKAFGRALQQITEQLVADLLVFDSLVK